MHSERYVHPEFGFLSPTPRLRRDLRTALLSLLFGIGIGATAVIALSGNKYGDDTQGGHWVSSVSVTSEEPRKTVLGYDDRMEGEPMTSRNRKTVAASVRLCFGGKFWHSRTCATLRASTMTRSEFMRKQSWRGYSAWWTQPAVICSGNEPNGWLTARLRAETTGACTEIQMRTTPLPCWRPSRGSE
jgi:hypothetical protein